MKTRLLAIVLIALMGALVHFEGMAAVDLVNLPDKIPAGNKKKFYDSAVSNPNSQTYTVLAFQEPGSTDKSGMVNQAYKKFSGYDDFQKFVQTNTWRLVTNILNRTSNTPSSEARAILTVVMWVSQPTTGNYESASEKYTFAFERDVGKFRELTLSGLTNTGPDLIRGVVYVTNLLSCNIEVKTPQGLYQNRWTQVSGAWTNTSVFPQEEIYKNIVFLNPWYASSGTNRVRIKFTKATTATFTQDGDKIESPTVMKMAGDKIGVIMPLGADVEIQSSTNLIDWVAGSTFSWSLHTNQVWGALNRPTPGQDATMRVYRARVW